MSDADFGRRALLAGVGGVVAGSLIASRARAVSPRQVSDHQAILDKIARMPEGFGECCLPVQAFPGTGTSAFRLTQDGSYYLNSNIVVTGSENGLEIDGNNIEVDLNGHSIIGPSGAAGLPSGTGIVVHGTNNAVYDGSVAYFDVGVDCSGASHSMVWDVTAIDQGRFGFVIGGPFNQNYDTEVHRSRFVGYLATDSSSLIQEGGAFACPVGFRILGSKNLVLSNSAHDCPSPFEIDAANAWGPIVVASGDLSLVVNGQDPNANLVT